MKWSSLGYGFGVREDRYAEEEPQAGRDCRQAVPAGSDRKGALFRFQLLKADNVRLICSHPIEQIGEAFGNHPPKTAGFGGLR